MKPLDFMALLAQTYPVHIPVISWDNLHPECNDSISAQLISDLLGFGRDYNQHRYDIYIYTSYWNIMGNVLRETNGAYNGNIMVIYNETMMRIINGNECTENKMRIYWV